MLAASKVKMSGSAKKKKWSVGTYLLVYDFSSKNVQLGSLTYVEVVLQNNGKEMYKQMCCAACKVLYRS